MSEIAINFRKNLPWSSLFYFCRRFGDQRSYFARLIYGQIAHCKEYWPESVNNQNPNIVSHAPRT